MKRIVAIVLLFVFAFSIAACSQNASVGNMPSDGTVPSTTDVTVTERAPSTYNIAVSAVSLSGEVFTSETPFVSIYSQDSETTVPSETKRSIEIGKKNYELTYSKFEWGKHIFSTADNVLQCYYDEVSGNILGISQYSSSDTESYITLPTFDSEEQYINWIKEFVSHYYSEDWNQYRYSCKTWITTSTETATWNDTYDDFRHATGKNESVSDYTFYFTRYIGDIPTSDRIRVIISLWSGNVHVDFNKHEFDAVKDVTFDTKVINQKIGEFLNNYISKEYTLVKYDLGTPTIIVSDGKYYLLYPVDMDLTADYLVGEPFGYAVMLTVEI